MLLNCEDSCSSNKKHFKFLNIWIDHESCKNVIILNFKIKTRKIKMALTIWIRETFWSHFSETNYQGGSS